MRSSSLPDKFELMTEKMDSNPGKIIFCLRESKVLYTKLDQLAGFYSMYTEE